MRSIFFILAFFMAFVTVGAMAQETQNQAVSKRLPPLAGDMKNFKQALSSTMPLPADLACQKADGSTLRLASLKGTPMVLNLWATWCQPCKAELPSLKKLQEQMADKLTVVAVSVDRGGWVAINRFLAKMPLGDVVVCSDPRMSVARTVGGSGLPTTLVFDSAQMEWGRLTGEADWSSPEALALIEHYLSGEKKTEQGLKLPTQK